MKLKTCIWGIGAAMATAGSAHAIDALDLTGGQATPVFYAGAYWATAFDQSSGSGVWQPFFDLQNPNGNDNTEAGYNTDGLLLMDQQRTAFNSDLPAAGLAPLTIPGIPVQVYSFWLDANETGGGSANRLLTVDTIRIYSSPTASIGVSTEAALAATPGANLLYDMDAGLGDASARVHIDSTIGDSSGSGSSDLIMYVPVSLFDGNPYIYFYNENGFSDADGPLGAHAGYEEWRARTGPGQQVPDGGFTLLLLGGAVAALGSIRLRGIKN